MNARKLSKVFVVAAAALLSAQWGYAQRVYRLSSTGKPVAESSMAEQDVQSSPSGEEGLGQYAGGCDSDCEQAFCGKTCCGPCWQFFGDYLYLRPRNAGVEYAVPINGPISAGQIPIQEGRTAAVNPQFDSGFRVGVGTAFDQCSMISATYTRYENRVHDNISTDAPLVIRSMVMHPSSLDAEADWLAASARQDISFEMADLDFRRIFYENDCASLSYLVGIRYANLEQRFRSQFESIITENVDTDVNFDGAGLRLGLEGERRSCFHNLFLYGKGYASLLGGEFRGTYLQSSINDPVVAQTDWSEARLVSILECEVGLGWASPGGHFRASAGYLISGWLNVVKSGDFITAVQANNYRGVDRVDGNGLAFDGLVTRVEVLW